MADAAAIAEAVGRACRDAAVTLRPDVLAALRAAAASEPSGRGRRVLRQLIENAEVAAADRVPLCQDTGTVWALIELGAEERLGGDLQARVDAEVARAFRQAGLRASIVRDAAFDRANTGDNTPAFLDVVARPGRGATVHVMLKGGGSDNSSALSMLEPAEGLAGVRRFVVETVRAKASGACPPLVVGVGVGGTFDRVAGLAKKALLRPLGTSPTGPHARETEALEAELLDAVNATGIGPGGLGGRSTALGVSVLSAPCHIAALPVAVNVGCSAVRSVTLEVA
ncbi:MAG: fumarate hydratase [Coriobacteriia bacterium]|nr:fumarate hydratase [Coriobacteriia bacterium]